MLKKERGQLSPWQNASVIKVAINRNTFKALEGQLYTVQEYYFNSEQFKTLSLFFASNYLDKDTFSKYLELVLLNGYGKKASTGKGYMEVLETKEANLPNAGNPNAFMVLGNYYPSEAEINNHKFAGFYALNTKFGKLGDAKAKSQNPFKQPHLVFEPGSVFKATPKGAVVGRLIENISKSEPEVWQHCQTLCLGVQINED
jgi:CRISPR-associated protein Csm4